MCTCIPKNTDKTKQVRNMTTLEVSSILPPDLAGIVSQYSQPGTGSRVAFCRVCRPPADRQDLYHPHHSEYHSVISSKSILQVDGKGDVWVCSLQYVTVWSINLAIMREDFGFVRLLVEVVDVSGQNPPTVQSIQVEVTFDYRLWAKDVTLAGGPLLVVGPVATVGVVWKASDIVVFCVKNTSSKSCRVKCNSILDVQLTDGWTPRIDPTDSGLQQPRQEGELFMRVKTGTESRPIWRNWRIRVSIEKGETGPSDILHLDVQTRSRFLGAGARQAPEWMFCEGFGTWEMGLAEEDVRPTGAQKPCAVRSRTVQPQQQVQSLSRPKVTTDPRDEILPNVRERFGALLPHSNLVWDTRRSVIWGADKTGQLWRLD